MSARTRRLLLTPPPKLPKREHPTPCCARDGGTDHGDCHAAYCVFCACDECKDGFEHGIRFPPGHDQRVKEAALRAGPKQLELFAERER